MRVQYFAERLPSLAYYRFGKIFSNAGVSTCLGSRALQAVKNIVKYGNPSWAIRSDSLNFNESLAPVCDITRVAIRPEK